MGLVLGIDIGTGSTKGVLADLTGAVVATARRDHAPTFPRAGWVEMDAERDWWGDVVAVARELTGLASGPIAGVCVSGLGPCLVVTDADGLPVGPGILYGIDTRAGAEIEEQTALLGEDAILARCGKTLSSQALGPKLAWWRTHRPWPAGAHWHSAHSFVVERLTGAWVLDHHTASQCDPLYDIHAQAWASDWADIVLSGVALPRLAWPAEQVGAITPEVAASTGLAVGTPVMAGTVDAWAEAFSAGVRRPGDLMLMYGSTMFLVQVLPAATAACGLWTTSGVERSSHTLAAGMSTSGSLTEWIRSLTGADDFGALVAEASEVPAGSDGVLCLPYFAGERSPIYDPDARGLLIGLSLRHGRAHLFRAAYEGIAFGIRQIVDSLEHLAGPPARTIAVGGGTQGGLWTRIVSDVTGLEQIVPKQTIGASYGDALMAAIGAGLVDPATDWAEVDRTVVPDPAHRGVYDELYAAYTALYPATVEQMHVLARLQSRVDD